MAQGLDRSRRMGVAKKQGRNRSMEEPAMRHEGSWIGKVIALAVFAVVGVAVMMAPGATGEPVTQNPSAPEFCAAGHTPDTGLPASAAQPAAICKLMPECWSNSDCDWKCGVGLGKCIHSRCPVRICVCR